MVNTIQTINPRWQSWLLECSSYSPHGSVPSKMYQWNKILMFYELICIMFCIINLMSITPWVGLFDVHVSFRPKFHCWFHYGNVIMGAIASQITSLTIVYATVYPGSDQRKIKAPRHWPFVWGIHRGPVNSPHKWPVTRKMFPFDDVIMCIH